MATTTNENIKKNTTEAEISIPAMEIPKIIAEDDTELPLTTMPVFDNPNCPVDDEFDDSIDDAISEYDDIDIACALVNDGIKKRNDNINTKLQNEAKKQQMERDREIENQRIAIRNTNIEKAKAVRRVRKMIAKNMTFVMAIISALCSTVVIGILIWICLDISEWLFAGTVGAIGMLNTLIHTYIYRYIREEIFHK